MTDKSYSVQRLLMGTHTSDGEPNHVLIAEMRMPRDDAKVDARKFDQTDAGGFGAAAGKIEVVQQIPLEGEVNRAR